MTQWLCHTENLNWTEDLLSCTPMCFVSLGFKQGTRFWSEELWELRLGISHSRRPSGLKLAYRLDMSSRKWGTERQRKTIPDKAAFSKYLLPKIRYFNGFSVNFNKFQNRCQINQNYAEKNLQNAVSMGFGGFCKTISIIYDIFSLDGCMEANQIQTTWRNGQYSGHAGLVF